MDEDQIRRLLWCQTMGLLIWYRGRDGLQQIREVGKDERNDEWMAYLTSGRGHYVDLYGCSSEDIMVTPGPVDWNNGLGE